jgi:hypothetical protein
MNAGESTHQVVLLWLAVTHRRHHAEHGWYSICCNALCNPPAKERENSKHNHPMYMVVLNDVVDAPASPA